MTIAWIIAGTLVGIPLCALIALPFITRADLKRQRQLERDRRRAESMRRLLGGGE